MENLDITCAQCSKLLAVHDSATDTHEPAPEPLLASGAVPVPNFGWFCSQECATHFEQAHGKPLFQRNVAGEVQYYP